MDGLLQYDAARRDQVPENARCHFDILARTYIVEFESPNGRQPHPEWYVQVRLPKGLVLAGYYGQSAIAAAASVLTSLQTKAAA